MTYIKKQAKSKQTNREGAGERAQQMKVLAAMPNNLSFILGSTWWKMNTTYFSLSSDFQTHSGLCAHKLTVTYTHN